MKFFFLTLVFLSSCNITNVPLTYKPSEKQKLVNQIRNIAAHRIQEKTGLVPCGTGAQMMDEIKMIALAFDYYKLVNINTGRQLLLIATQELVNEINRNEQVRKYLYHYPFRPDNVEVRIFFRNPDGTEVKDGELCVASIIDEKIKYKTNDPNYKLFKTLQTETYLQALKKTHKLRFTFQ